MTQQQRYIRMIIIQILPLQMKILPKQDFQIKVE
jgi:hypothetical protein